MLKILSKKFNLGELKKVANEIPNDSQDKLRLYQDTVELMRMTDIGEKWHEDNKYLTSYLFDIELEDDSLSEKSLNKDTLNNSLTNVYEKFHVLNGSEVQLIMRNVIILTNQRIEELKDDYDNYDRSKKTYNGSKKTHSEKQIERNEMMEYKNTLTSKILNYFARKESDMKNVKLMEMDNDEKIENNIEILKEVSLNLLNDKFEKKVTKKFTK